MNKKVRIESQDEREDRLSSLSDDVIHRILSFLGTRLAVQTSILSKRWKHIWTTLPFLTFDGYDQLFPFTHSGIIKFIDHVLSHRNHQLNIFSFKFLALYPFPQRLILKVIEYPISHNVQDLDFDLRFHRHHPFKLSAFSSNSIQKLKLGVHLDFSKLWESGGCWDLPVLESLHLVCPIYMSNYKVLQSCLICLPALTTLRLDRCEFPESVSMSLPGLTTLTLARCKLPRAVWDFPALLTLELDAVLFPHNMSELFSALVILRNLTIIFPKRFVQKYFIYCSQLVNLKIGTSTSTCITPTRNIVIWAPKLCEICCVGIFQVRLFVNELENANIKLLGTTEFHNLTLSRKKVFYHRLRRMFYELGSTKSLTIDSATFEVLSAFSNFVEHVPSPLYNLKYVKLPRGYKESSITNTLRKFLLGVTPGATIVTTLPQNNENYQAVHFSLTSQMVMLDEPSKTPTKELVDSQDIHEKVCVDNVEKRVQVEYVVENSVVDADRVRHAGAQVARKGINQASSSRGNSNFWLWQGLEINSEFVGLLDLIVEKYPETFEHFTAKSETFYTMKLNMLCTSVNEFLTTSMTELCTDTITEYKDIFADLQRWGFNVYWLVSHLNYIEQLWLSENVVHTIDSRAGYAKSKLHDLQSYCLEKRTQI